MDTYSSALTYIVGQQVIQGGILYTATAFVPVNTEPPNDDFWQMEQAPGVGPLGAWVTTTVTADPDPARVGVLYRCDASGGAFGVTLPGGEGPTIPDGSCIRFKKIDSSGNAVTINAVDGSTVVLSAQYDATEVQFANTVVE